MLFILTGVLFIIGLVSYFTQDEEIGIGLYISSAIFLVITLIVLACYNDTKASCDKKIEVLEEKNELVLKQVEPIINKYLTYEGETFEKLKVSSENIVALSMYPELKGNEFLKSQIDIVVKNQDEITKLKLNKAELNAYKLWIFMGE
jgi:hypothetical protein